MARRNAAAQNVAILWKHAEFLEETKDKNNDPNIVSIKRFVSPFRLNNETALVYFTLKESLEAGHRLYSIELMGIAKLRGQGGTLQSQSDTTPAANDQ